MAKSSYFSNTHPLQTLPTIDGVRSSVADGKPCSYKEFRIRRGWARTAYVGLDRFLLLIILLIYILIICTYT